MAKGEPKYRASLTESNIDKILSLCKLEAPMSNESMYLIGYLAPIKTKIINAGITAAYTTAPKASVEESLGMAAIETRSKEAIWKDCYYKWKEDPTSCSLEEINGANEHRYLEDMMTPEEETEWENK